MKKERTKKKELKELYCMILLWFYLEWLRNGFELSWHFWFWSREVHFPLQVPFSELLSFFAILFVSGEFIKERLFCLVSGEEKEKVDGG